VRRRDQPSNVLTTLVFTDIVASSQVAEELGDRRWRELLARHHRIVREGLRACGGRELDTAGDGVFARFDSPASAINFAAATADALRELGIEIRAGIHIGECEVFEGKLSGVNVHAAARTMAQAGAGEILVTGSVRDLVRGAGFGFADRGVHELRGIEGDWHLFELTSIDDSHRSPPLPEGEAQARRDQIVPPPLVKKRRVRLAAAGAVLALVVAGGAFALVHAVAGASSGPLSGCEVTSNPPLRDRAFNEAPYDGLTDAATKWGIDVRAKVANNPGPTWKRAVDDFIQERCGLIVTLGTVVGAQTVAAAKTHPEQRFVSSDAAGVRGSSNLLSIQFRAEQAAFLAGYLAAGVTKTGKVGTFGAIPLPTVTPFMNGFAAGVLHYNQLHGTRVKVIGTDRFVSRNVSDFSTFANPGAAQALAAALIRSGADVIFPVAGSGGENGACAAVQRARNTLLIGVDVDQFYSTPGCSSEWLTSVQKFYRSMIYRAMGQVVQHRFKGGLLVATLANGGVGLAPFHLLARRVPARLRTELARAKQSVISRSVSLDPQDYSSR
jgi:basic membrane protein A